MGQFFNQPDFGTEATDEILPVNKTDAVDGKGYLGAACLYIGTAGDLQVIIAGTLGSPNQSFTPVLFKNVPAGSILPVIVDYIISTKTTASDFVALK
jgi:hypothetical protein